MRARKNQPEATMRTRLSVERLDERIVPTVYVETGEAVQVNAVANGLQQNVQLAADGQNNVLVTWADSGLDGSGFGIYARRANGTLATVGNQFRVNTKVAYDESYPSISTNAAGASVVAWREDRYDNGQPDGINIKAQRYLNGVAQGPNITVSDPAFGEYNAEAGPSVWVAPDGGFTVIFQTGHDEDSLFYGFLRYSASGALIGSSTVDISVSGSDWSRPEEYGSIRFDTDGSALIPWRRSRYRIVTDVGEFTDNEKYVSRVSPTGVALNDIRVSAVTLPQAVNVPLNYFAAVELPDGGFLVTQVNSGGALVGRRYSTAGVAQGAEFEVMDTAGSTIFFGPFISLSDGNVVFSWNDFVPFSDLGGNYVRVFTPNGTPVTDPLPLPEVPYHNLPSLAPDNAGGFFYAWGASGGGAGDDSEVLLSHFVKIDGPTAVSLSAASVPEFRPAGAAVGNLSAAPAGRNYTFALVSGTGSTDNAKFSVSGNQLMTAAPLDLAAKASYSVRVRATDEYGQTVDQVLTVTPTDDPSLARDGFVLYVLGSAANDAFAFAEGATLHGVTLNGAARAVDAATVDTVVFFGGAGTNAADVTGRGTGNVAGLNPTYGFLASAKTTVWAVDSASISVHAGGAGSVAYLVGTTGADTLTAYPTAVSLAGTGYANTAAGFGATVAYSQGGADLANFTGSAGNDVFVGRPESSQMAGTGFSNYAIGFKTVSAKTGGGKDAAYLVDSAGNDTLSASGTVATLTTPTTSVRVDGFSVIAFGFAGGTNKKQIGTIFFYLATSDGWQ